MNWNVHKDLGATILRGTNETRVLEFVWTVNVEWMDFLKRSSKC